MDVATPRPRLAGFPSVVRHGSTNEPEPRLASLTLEEMTEVLNRGWGHHDSQSAMLLQEAQSGVDAHVLQEDIQGVLAGEDGRGLVTV